MARKRAERPHLARCVLMTGSLPAGILMYRLMVWKPTRQIGGRWWFAKSHDELQFETGLTLKQIRSALSLLREKDYIKTSQHIFQGRNLNHYLVTEAFVQEFKKMAQEGPYGTTGVGPTGTTQE